MSYDVWMIRLLAINACSLLVFGILLLVLLLISKRGSYYRRVGLTVPRQKGTMERLVITLLRIAGMVLLIGLLVLLAYFTLRYISQSELMAGGGGQANNSTGKSLPAPKNSSVFGIYKPLGQLGNAQDYGMYFITGLMALANFVAKAARSLIA